MTLAQLPVGKEGVIETVRRRGKSALSFFRYGPYSRDKSESA